MANEIPVYLFVGFLESGKTKFIQETFEDPNFDSGDKTLLLICEEGEVDASVFDRYLVPLYKQASYKPYIIAAMIFLAQVKDPVKALMDLDSADNKRKMF